MTNVSNARADWAVLGLLSASLLAAVMLRGGVYSAQWAWSAIGIGSAFLLVANPMEISTAAVQKDAALWLLAVLFGWTALQMVPLPPAVVAIASPERWSAISAARRFTGADPRAWMALSVEPGATFERLLDVIPAMTAFFAIRTLAARWRSSMWLLVAPVVLAAWLESGLGMVQFRTMRASAGISNAVTGTYVNRDHFAALLEMAFPLALLWALSLWCGSKAQRANSSHLAFATVAMLAVAACLLLGVTFSASRMGFVATLAGAAISAGILLAQQTYRFQTRPIVWRWAAALVLPACLFVALPTRELVDRYRDLVQIDRLLGNPRVEIWRDSLPMIAAYKWVGCGLGAFEYGSYRFNSRLPMDTVDFAHNDYLQITAELGLVGAALAMGLALWIGWRLLSCAFRMRAAENWELAVGLLGALFAIALHSFTDFNLYIPANALVVAWLCGIADSLCLSSSPLHS